MSQKIVLFWDSSVSDMKHGRQFGGIAVQLNFWMQVFARNGWAVHALTTGHDYKEEDVNYHHICHIQSVELVWEWLSSYLIIQRIRPDLIIFRGAKRVLFPICAIAHAFGSKVIMQGASDINFIPGKAAVGNNINSRLYEASMPKIDYIISQNEYQASTLKQNYNRNSLIIPNIWGSMPVGSNSETTLAEVVWVGNFRHLKRPEWFLEAARNLPDIKFAMAGSAASAELYNEMEREAKSIPNLDFLGQIPIEKSNMLIGNAKLLVCSSEYEGFPNTFLQAWASGVPVVSTVDPNDLIKTYNLGIIVDSPESLVAAIEKLTKDNGLYQTLQRSINSYFSVHHSAQICFENLMKYISDNE